MVAAGSGDGATVETVRALLELGADPFERVEDAAVCRDDLAALWRRELVRQEDGTYTRRRMFAAREDASWRAAA